MGFWPVFLMHSTDPDAFNRPTINTVFGTVANRGELGFFSLKVSDFLGETDKRVTDRIQKLPGGGRCTRAFEYHFGLW